MCRVTATAPSPAPAAALTWSWSTALLGLAYGLPAAVVTRADPDRGLTLAVGVLCAAAVGLQAVRRTRTLVVFVGAVSGLGLFLGSLLHGVPTLGVMLVLFVLALLASVTAPLTRLGPFLLTLSLPLVAAGLNIDSPSRAVSAGLLILTGSAYAFVISLLWPEPPPPPRSRRRPAPAPRSVLLDYGVRLGLVAAITVGVGLMAGIDHPGWAATAALLTGRPDPAQTEQRVPGSALSVIAGAGAALLVHAVDPTATVLAACVGVAVALCCGLTGSRWVTTPAFTSFVVLTMLMVSSPVQTEWWAAERAGGTLLGVATAWILLDWVPVLRDRRAARRRAGEDQPR
jgi:Fusaric acid resistance protein-like